ncbi:PhzF family phenazine biosynthesis protein [Egicoccus sp. AB-alg2]|uniref:PhzF family phenazine biosynthesis protein n=1 Tax=Egicoccus sp. AB-alg2 TaxID=3242693 RepID=UPI00359E91C8
MPEAAATIHRLAAFTTDPDGGNPAGVVITDAPLDALQMQEMAADVGYSETAFLVPSGDDRYTVRYFAPMAEVPFCGHATIAAGVLLAGREGPGTVRFDTPAGAVTVELSVDDRSRALATLTSVEPSVEPAAPDVLDAALSALRLRREELDPVFEPAVAFAGALHLLLVLRTRERLARLDYDFEALRAHMLAHGLTTVALLWPERIDRWHARNAFPVGGVVEDPATGAAAAATGAYLRASGHLAAPARFEVLQGEDLGRPSHLYVEVAALGGIRVSGHAVSMPTP